MITPGNIITLIICLAMVIVFRQLDKNNRSLEKIKKFSDKLKEDLELFMKERMNRLEESSIALDVQQSKAVAAVNRLESIRADIAERENALLERVQSVENFGKRIDGYDATLSRLLEMTALAEKNLAAVRDESDFADSLAKKILASRKQLEDIAKGLPELRAQCAEDNRVMLSSIHAETLERLSGTMAALEQRVVRAESEGAALLEQGTNRLKELYQKAFSEAAKKADALEDSAFAKLKEQATERLAKYREAVEEKTAALHEQTKERIHEVQALVKSFRTSWQAEAEEYLESTRSEVRRLESDTESAISRIDDNVRSSESLVQARIEQIEAELHRIESGAEQTVSLALERSRAETEELEKNFSATVSRIASESRSRLEALTADLAGQEELSRARLAELSEVLAQETESLSLRLNEGISSLGMQLESDVSATSRALEDNRSRFEQVFTELDNRLSQHVQNLERAITAGDSELAVSLQKSRDTVAERLESLRAEYEARLAEYRSRYDEELLRVDQNVSAHVAGIDEIIGAGEAKFALQLGKSREEALLRLKTVQDTLEERLAALSGRLEEHSHAVESTIAESRRGTEDSITRIRSEVARLLEEAERNLQGDLAGLEQRMQTELRKAETGVDQSVENLTGKLDVFSVDIESRIAGFERLVTDAEQLDAQLHIALAETEKRVLAGFTQWTAEQQNRQNGFVAQFEQDALVLSDRMNTLESGLNELKSRAYDNVSSKLKMFEDDFFADLSKRSDAITAALDGWKENVDSRLENLSAEAEASRSDLETVYAADLKERLSAISDQYRQHTDRLESHIASVEAELRGKITESDTSIHAFVEQFRTDFAEARKAAEQHARNEFDSHHINLMELLRNQERDIELKTRGFAEIIEGARTDAAGTLEEMKGAFAAWQTRNEQLFASSQAQLSERLEGLSGATDSAIASLKDGYDEQYRAFMTETRTEREALQRSLDELKGDMVRTEQEFSRKTTEALESFGRAYDEMAGETARRIRETSAETDQTIKLVRQSVQDMRDNLDKTRAGLVQKLEADTSVLGQTLEEIDRKQKAFIAQTRVFDRAEELRTSLETGIDNLKGELSRLDVYRETMKNLEQQYQKVRKLEEESSQKITRFLTEKKRVDILESDFNKLLALSDSIDRKLSEFTVTNDDLQQFQVQIRRFEEIIAEVNGRYERLDKKSLVLDQTVEGIDRAFEELKSLEKEVATYRQAVSSVPAELEEVRGNIALVLENRDKASSLVEKLSDLDGILEDVEKRTDKMQTAREWLARTETRLEEISRQSQDQLKLLSDLLKDESPAKKTGGAPSPGIRENVVKLAHQGWKTDEIARALKLSRGEVELILELPQR